MISFRNVGKRYAGGFEALRGVTFDISPGEMVFLTGHSGAGKSTLLKLITCLEHASVGQVLVAGHNLNRLNSYQIPYLRRAMGVVFQNPQLLFDRNVYQNVALPLYITGYPRHEVGRRVRAALDKVGLLEKERASPATLSGGEQQRLSIARAVVHKPRLILADEPTGNLDPALSAEIMRLFAQFNSVGATVLIASHDLALLKRLGLRCLTLSGGQLVGDGALLSEGL